MAESIRETDAPGDGQGGESIRPQPVKIIAAEGQSALVEWRDESGKHRSIVPAETVHDGAVIAPEQGAPYGVDWESLVDVSGMEAAIATELRRSNIWTYDDLQANPALAQGAINRVVGAVYSKLLRSSRRA